MNTEKQVEEIFLVIHSAYGKGLMHGKLDKADTKSLDEEIQSLTALIHQEKQETIKETIEGLHILETKLEEMK